MNILKIFVYVFVGLYSVLTIIAGIADAMERKKFYYWHSFYIIGAILMIVSLLSGMPKYMLPIALGLMVITAIYNGNVTDNLQPSHIMVRTIISLGLVAIWYIV